MMDAEELVTVYTTDDANQAEIIRGALQSQGIRCLIDGEHQAGFIGAGVVEVKLLVRAIDHDRARKFIDQHEHDHS